MLQSALLILLSGLSYFIFYKEEVDDFQYNIKRGLIGVALVFLAFGLVQVQLFQVQVQLIFTLMSHLVSHRHGMSHFIDPTLLYGALY